MILTARPISFLGEVLDVVLKIYEVACASGEPIELLCSDFLVVQEGDNVDIHVNRSKQPTLTFRRQRIVDVSSLGGPVVSVILE